jgi:RNA polymerase sigma-70 factor (ECF subfamily)
MRAWLFSIMHNLHVNRLRQPGLATEALSDELHSSLSASGPAPSDRLEIRDLQSALQMLPAEQREVLLLVALEELSYEEAAAVLNIPAGTVMSRLSRARERLRLLMLGQAPASTLKVVK